jgi:hypothetical protein
MRVRSNAQPPVGQVCLVMAGKANQDLGQVGIVVRQAASMVEVAMKAPVGSRVLLPMKQPSSLIYLEPGLTLVQDSNGSVWIQRGAQTCEE